MASRRQLLRGGLRFATLGVIGVAGGAVAVKRRRLLREGKCVNRGICKRCGVFSGCGLPRAISVRRSVGEGA